MRAVVQRVLEAEVSVDGARIGHIESGLLVLVGLEHGDSESTLEWLARKIPELRIFNDTDGNMNRSLLDVQGGCLLVSQFTLLGDTEKGRRPSFIRAMSKDLAEPMILRLAVLLRERLPRVELGKFGAHMRVKLVNDGPVTLVLDRSPS
jgi:D-tyrosyl-tRNA(Tyr) deacylase